MIMCPYTHKCTHIYTHSKMVDIYIILQKWYKNYMTKKIVTEFYKNQIPWILKKSIIIKYVYVIISCLEASIQ